MLHYIIQTIAFQILFLIIYDVFLKKETFFNYNRTYLLISSILSLLLPFIKIESFKEVLPKEYIFNLPEVFIGKPELIIPDTDEAFQIAETTINTFSFSWFYVVYLGCTIAFVLFLIKLIGILVSAYKNPKTRIGKTLLVELINSTAAFSFFNYIFLGNNIKAEEKQTILAHELEHVKQKHSLDLLFFEVLRILFWFNPIIYIYQNRISNLHEFIADAKAVKSSNKENYYQNLLSQVFETHKVSFINPFFKQSLIKKRIIMLSKNKSKQINLVKYVLLIPLIFVMLSYTSAEAQVETTKTKTTILSEEELLVKYKQEYKEQYKNDRTFRYLKEGNFPSNSYIQTKEEFVKSKAFWTFMTERLKEEGKVKNTEGVFLDSKMRTSYSEYLKNKKTQKFIDNWENSSNMTFLRKHVKDLDNITVEEQKLIDSKISQIKNDDWYHTLIISDGLRHKKIEIKKEEKSINVTNSNNSSTLDSNEEVSFAVIDQVPIFPGCDGSENEKKCMSNNINKLVAQNFDVKLGERLGLTGKQKIQVFFTINKQGDIINIKTRAPHPDLEKEAKRVVSILPKLKPGEQDGKPVNVTFFLPIKININ